jgi:DNA-binding MarR family transcriptional regulator
MKGRLAPANNSAILLTVYAMKEAGMKNPIEHLNKIFDSRIRLGIMSAVIVNDAINFNDLKELIDVTDGNLASHLKTLEENGYIKVQKGFVGRKTNTTYSVTRAGEKAFRQHLDALEQMIKSIE